LNIMKACSALTLSIIASVAFGDQNVGFPGGKYDGHEIASRMGSSGKPLKAVGAFASQSFYLNLKERPAKEMRKLFQDSLGLELIGGTLRFSIQEQDRQKVAETALDEKVKDQFGQMLSRLRNGLKEGKEWDKCDPVEKACIVYDSWAASYPKLFTAWYLSTHNLSELRKRSFVYYGRLDKLFDRVKAPKWLKEDYINRWFSFSSGYSSQSLYLQLAEAKKRFKETKVFFRISYTPGLRSFFVIEEKVREEQSGWLSEGSFLPIPEYVGRFGDWRQTSLTPTLNQPVVRPTDAETIQDWITDNDRSTIEPALRRLKKNIDGVEVIRYDSPLLDGVPFVGRIPQSFDTPSLKEAANRAGRMSDRDILAAQSSCQALAANRYIVMLPVLRLISSLSESEKDLMAKNPAKDQITIDLSMVRKRDRQALYRAVRNIVQYPSNMMGMMEIDCSFYGLTGDDPLLGCFLELHNTGCTQDLEFRIGRYSKIDRDCKDRVYLDYPSSDWSYMRAISFNCPFIARQDRPFGK